MPILGAIFKGNRVTLRDSGDRWFTIVFVIDSFTFDVEGDNGEKKTIDVTDIVRIDKT